jgi:hypothetical protein
MPIQTIALEAASIPETNLLYRLCLRDTPITRFSIGNMIKESSAIMSEFILCQALKSCSETRRLIRFPKEVAGQWFNLYSLHLDDVTVLFKKNNRNLIILAPDNEYHKNESCC